MARFTDNRWNSPYKGKVSHWQKIVSFLKPVNEKPTLIHLIIVMIILIGAIAITDYCFDIIIMPWEEGYKGYHYGYGYHHHEHHYHYYDENGE